MARLCDLLIKNSGLEAEQIQKKLNISRRTFFRYLDELRTFGALIIYEKQTNCYSLENEFDVLAYFAEKVV